MSRKRLVILEKEGTLLDLDEVEHFLKKHPVMDSFAYLTGVFQYQRYCEGFGAHDSTKGRVQLRPGEVFECTYDNIPQIYFDGKTPRPVEEVRNTVDLSSGGIANRICDLVMTEDWNIFPRGSIEGVQLTVESLLARLFHDGERKLSVERFQKGSLPYSIGVREPYYPQISVVSINPPDLTREICQAGINLGVDVVAFTEPVPLRLPFYKVLIPWLRPDVITTSQQKAL